MTQNTLRKCRRCNGSGQLVGSGPRERPWNSFAALPVHRAVEKIMGMQRPEPCPDCGGTGQIRRTAA